VIILSLSQALAFSVAPAVTLIGGILGSEMAPNPSLATLPISIMVVGLALNAVPAALLMQRIGRRLGFMAAALLTGLACLLAAYAVGQENFLLYCLATFLIGVNGAFVMQYRFAAAESVAPQYVGRAVSLVLVGGIAAGFLGPEIVKRTKDWLDYGLYTGSFASLAILFLVVFLLMIFYQDVTPSQAEASGEERSLRVVVAQPIYLTALAAGVVSYGVMTFIMTATPVSMHILHGFTIDQTAWVIQSHVIAMYLPSLFTGFLVEKLGSLRMMVLGLLVMLTCAGLALVNQELLGFWGALVLLGIGWNLLFVGGTTLLTRSYHPAERFKAQAVNDSTVFGVQALASFSAGTVIFLTNWKILITLTLPFLVVLLGGLIILRGQIYMPAEKISSLPIISSD
jgi:MFS family permease